MGGEVAPEEVGLNGAVLIVVAKIWDKCCGVRKGQGEAVRDTAKMNRLYGKADLRKGSNWEDGFPFVGDKVAVVGAGDLGGRYVTI